MRRLFILSLISAGSIVAQQNKPVQGGKKNVVATPSVGADTKATPASETAVQQAQPEPRQGVDADNGLRSKKVAILAHGGYMTSSMSYGYWYNVPIPGKKIADEVRFTREITAIGGGLGLAYLAPISGILYGGGEAGISLFSVQKYQTPSYSNVSQLEGRIYADGFLGISFTENIGIYAGAGFQTYYVSPLKVDGKTTDPSFGATFGIMGVNAIAGLHLVFGKIIINPSFMADLALIGTASNDTIHYGDGFATRKGGDIYTARISVGYAFSP